MSKAKSPSTTPQTINQLTRWMDSEFSLLRQMVALGIRSRDETHSHEPSTEKQTEEPVKLFCDSLREAVTHLGAILESSTSYSNADGELVHAISRAVLLAGNGDSFEPAVALAIRHYTATFKELQRVRAKTDLNEADRDDIVAGLKHLLHFNADLLHAAGVELDKVEPGTPFDRARHSVAARLTTDNPEKLRTVSECVQPGFRWKGGDGKERFEPAVVGVFADLEGAQVSTGKSNGKPRRRPR